MASNEIKKVIDDTINSHDSELRSISLQIHDHPEGGNKEFKAFQLLTGYLEKKGFQVSRGVVGLETAFIAEFSNGKSGRRIGFCSEYDALPGVGHACGHNLIAISGVACALAIKKLLEQDLISGSVYLFGTPAEESTSGKTNFVKTGTVQRLVDFSMMLHPGPGNGLYVRALALDSFTVEFFGKQSHAGAAPWNGINAVDALMQGFNNVVMFRQQTLSSNRVHGIIKDGGKSPNVIPGYASAYFYARSVTRIQLQELKTKLENCFYAAGIATGCHVKITYAACGQIDDVFTNEILAETYIQHMKDQGEQFHSRQEEEAIVTGSTDMGNITYVVPGIHAGFDIGTLAANHTKEFEKAAATPLAHDKALVAARCLSVTAADVFINQDLYKKAVAYFKKGKAQ